MNWGVTADKIREIVQAGFCYTALTKNIVSIRSLLKWLTQQNMSEETLVAYRCICLIAKVEEHYIGNQHFTTILEDIEYLLIFILSGGNDRTPAFKDTNIPLIQQRANELAEIYRSKKRYTRIRILCGYESSELFKHLSMATHNHKSGLQHKSNNNDLHIYFKVQWFEMIYKTIKPEDYRILIKESLDMSTKYKWLWDTYLRDCYSKIVKHLYSSELPESITKKDVDEISELYPGIIATEIQELSRDAFEIYRHHDDILKAYLLGFPIHYFIPSSKRLQMALTDLTLLGVDEYIQKMQKMQPDTINGSMFEIDLSYHNDQDIFHENIQDYSAFDIYTYIEGNQIYRFTRPEFKSLIHHKKNFWSNVRLPDIVILELQKRLKIAENHNLPKSKIWKELLQQPRILNINNLSSYDFNNSITNSNPSQSPTNSQPANIILQFPSNSTNNPNVPELTRLLHNLSSSHNL